jgi:predicted Fe-Mo cluster-binding NifX family protein
LATLRQVIQSLSPAELVSAQLAWLKAHPREAFDLVVRARKGPSAAQWADQHLRSLAEEEAFVTSRDQLLRNWAYVRRVLGADLFMKHVREMLDRDAARAGILSSITAPSAVLDAIAASEMGERASYVDEAEQAGIRVLAAASPSNWDEALKSSSTEALLTLALRVGGSSGAPKNPPGLQDAIHAHFKTLADEPESEAWQPDGATFKQLTRLLNAPSRKVLASQFCAELEGRDGQVGPQLFATYGEFLSNEAGFRSHPKLPNVLERFLARDEWSVVAWFVELARQHPDALDGGGRHDEMQHLQEKVAEKLEAAGESPPTELVELGGLFGLEPPLSSNEDGPVSPTA